MRRWHVTVDVGGTPDYYEVDAEVWAPGPDGWVSFFKAPPTMADVKYSSTKAIPDFAVRLDRVVVIREVVNLNEETETSSDG